LRHTIWIKLLFVVEGDRSESQDDFARLIHRLDLVLEPGRGNDSSEFSGGINHYCYFGSTGYGFAVNPGDIACSVRPLLADANLSGVARYPQIADINIVTAAGETGSGVTPDADVARAFVVEERLKAFRDIVVADDVEKERAHPAGHVVVTSRVLIKCAHTCSRVIVAACCR